jgi:L-asparaginase II
MRKNSNPEELQPEKGAIVYRGDTAESLHHVAIAVVDGSGALTHYVGNPFRPISTRSSVKPFQALPLVMSGAAERYGLSQKQLAVVCASHSGTDEHKSTVESVLAAAGNRAEHLKCGTHWPIEMRQQEIWPLAGEDKDPVRHNCSGKHSGFLALTRHLNGEVEHYLDPESETQQLVRKAVGAYCEYPPEQLGVAIDGCSAPVFTMPLLNLAIGFKKLASAEGETPEVQQAAEKIRDAMHAYPYMISGNQRLDYDLARSFPGNVVCKVGAEAVQGIGFMDPPIGIAVKVLDGAPRARDPIVLEVLRQLGIIGNIQEYPLLERYDASEIKNYRNLVTGRVSAEFSLRKVMIQ